MFSTKLTRVAHRASSAVVIANPTTSTTTHRPSSCVTTRRSHQRRHSSSKASCPPDSSASGGKPAPGAKTSTAVGDGSPIADSAGQTRTKRGSRTKKPRAASMSKVEDQFAGLPSVRNTQAWRHDDFSVSSFFSLHRPLSLAGAIPRAHTAEEFASVFESRQQGAWENGNSAERRPEDVIYTLHPHFNFNVNPVGGQEGFNSFENGLDNADPNAHDGVRHLDGAPNTSPSSQAKTVNDLIDSYSFIPFKAPPPPEPFVKEKASGKKRAAKRETLQHQIQEHLNSPTTRKRSFQTTVTMTESTSEDGQLILIAERSPFVQVPTPEIQVSVENSPSSHQAPKFWAARPLLRCVSLPNRSRRAANGTRVVLMTQVIRVIRDAPTNRSKMILISVKRQRKLKMKKHKYKKLMKKTRNLRRRQDRA